MLYTINAATQARTVWKAKVKKARFMLPEAFAIAAIEAAHGA